MIRSPGLLKSVVFLSLGFLLITTVPRAVSADVTDPFPVFPGIVANVEFWKKIYTQYHTRQGVIHDTDNVAIVYEIIDLKDEGKGSRRQNSKLIKATNQKYQSILEQLAKGKKAVSDDEIRVAGLFGSNPDPIILLQAVDKIRFQRGQADRFRQGIIHSGRYLDRIKEIFRDNGLPDDLAYLPHVESSFNYEAYSKFGAAGIWQFTYGTGKRFMTIDYTVDERRDPVTSAHAAAMLLNQNHEKLGNWALAITAYNHGVNSMLRAQKEKGDYETILDEYDGRRFRFASKNFYSEFLAAREIAKNYELYFGKLEMAHPIQVEFVEMPAFVSVRKIAAHFNTDLKTIQFLNPALRRPVFDDQKLIPKGYKLRLPRSPEIRQLATSMPSALFEPEQKRSRFYYVRRGDVAGAIARQHGITLQELIWANNLNHRATIYVGQNLRIPTKEDSIALISKHSEQVASLISSDDREKTVIEKEQLSFNNGTVENGDVKAAPDINLSVVSGNLTVKGIYKKNDQTFGVIHAVTGETLGHYADWLEISTQTLRDINGFSFGTIINFNDLVTIPLDRIGKEQFEEKRYEYHKEFEEDFLGAFRVDSVTHYEIKPGDTIWSLCQDVFEMPFWLIRRYNQDLDLDHLKPFQKITVPVIEKIESNTVNSYSP
jgi:membrane-bound lytic murein transglycosylase D